MSSPNADATSLDGETGSNARLWWSILGLGGMVSLCCLVAPTTSVTTGTAVSGASATVGGSLIRILVAALTVGVIGIALRLRTGARSSK